ncbi:hypothetical protein HT136_25700 [Novosphingobium profundi]|uniref:hypothetical protein n=1 Tax=Novosphingobium profundi TaxID=1774954 RepID=UPI001BDA5841|nr:hypothetical protein [Novosphingobium profundi]
MTFSYGLLGALLLLLPGFAFVVGVRSGEPTNFATPRPDPPNSHATIFKIVTGALLVHTVGAAIFAFNEALYQHWHFISIEIDPNPYKMLLLKEAPSTVSSNGIAWEGIYFVFLTGLSLKAGEIFSRNDKNTTERYPQRFGWLLPIAEKIEKKSHLALGFVRTTSTHNGAWIGYEGLVQRVALDDDKGITMVVLEQCDRFLVEIANGEIRRIDSNSEQIAMMQFKESQIADFAIDLIDYDGGEQEESGSRPSHIRQLAKYLTNVLRQFKMRSSGREASDVPN